MRILPLISKLQASDCYLLRMFTSSLFEEAKALQEDIAAVAEKVNDPAMCEKVRLFVYAPKEIQAIYRADASKPRFTAGYAIKE